MYYTCYLIKLTANFFEANNLAWWFWSTGTAVLNLTYVFMKNPNSPTVCLRPKDRVLEHPVQVCYFLKGSSMWFWCAADAERPYPRLCESKLASILKSNVEAHWGWDCSEWLKTARFSVFLGSQHVSVTVTDHTGYLWVRSCCLWLIKRRKLVNDCLINTFCSGNQETKASQA